MKFPKPIYALVLVWAVLAAGVGRALARGCMPAGTQVLTPTGSVAIETLEQGDIVCSIEGSALRQAKVVGRFEVTTNSILEVTAGGHTLRLTPEHPIQTQIGQFTEAGYLQPGGQICLWQNGALRPVTIDSIRSHPGFQTVYNLVVGTTGVFIADSVVVHNKGCFVADAPILKADGQTAPISSIRPGDRLMAFRDDGTPTTSSVEDVIRYDVDEYFKVTTDRMVTLRVTKEHPFFIGKGTFKTLAALKVGDSVFGYDGRGWSEQKILSIERVAEHTTVFNLVTEEPHTFFAYGIAVHNKGCLAAGTPISTPTGPVAIEKLSPGDTVWSVIGTGLHQARVIARYEVAADEILEIHAAGRTLRSTPEHPIQTNVGTFLAARRLSTGDGIWVWNQNSPQLAQIDSISIIHAPQKAYNLMVSPGGTYIAGGIIVHNKGCFLPDAPILKADGSQAPIRAIKPGDLLAAFTPEGQRVDSRVEDVVTFQVDEYCRVTTDRITMEVTAEHPFFVGDGTFKTLSVLKPGDFVFGYDGSGWSRQTILKIEHVSRPVTVFNLITDDPHTYFAYGVAVHNKGGHSFGGGHFFGGSSGHYYYSGGHRYYSSTRPWGDDAVGLGVWFGVFAIASFFSLLRYLHSTWVASSPTLYSFSSPSRTLFGRDRADEDLDFVYTRPDITHKATQTTKLLEHLATQDPSLNPQSMIAVAKSTFIKLQQCWQARQFTPMQPLLMPDLYQNHLRQLGQMISQHEIDHIDDLTVESVDIVLYRRTLRPDQKEFTALITASAKDYYTDDRDGSFIRGDQSPARFQEFWIFQFKNGLWLLREIDQSKESDALRQENVVDGMSDAQIQAICGVVPMAPAPPGADPRVSGKESRLDTRLAFLAQKDGMWGKPSLISRARDIFTAVTLCEEAGDLSHLQDDDLLPDGRATLQGKISRRLAESETIEYRNLCVRKVDVVAVRPHEGKQFSQFVARISAHAQICIMRGSTILRHDEYEMPYEQYLTFAWDRDRWKLKEILSPAQGLAAVSENDR